MLLSVRIAVGLAAWIVLAEILLGAAFPPPDQGEQYFRDWEQREISQLEAVERGLIVPVEPSPRFRANFVPGVKLRLCYRPFGEQAWLDEFGGVPLVYNSRSVRDREAVCAPKPAGQLRVLFLGDSITCGWGVPAEQACCRLVEDALRENGRDVRTINCGASGTLYLDEYRVGLEHRFAAFEPDVVIVAIGINDLLNLNTGIVHRQPAAWWAFSSILRACLEGDTPHRLSLDPALDWVGELLALPAASPEYQGVGREQYWAGGGPQRELIAMRDWCRERDVAFGVVLWPALQGLDAYAFTRMHELLRAFCEAEEIPFCDLLPAFLGRSAPELWVAPYDPHGNPTAQRIAAKTTAPFVAELLR